jgi:hypothetical protein
MSVLVPQAHELTFILVALIERAVTVSLQPYLWHRSEPF